MRVVVTGATGFVGRNLVRHLSKIGYDVHAVVRKSSNLAAFAGDLDDAQIFFYDGTTEAICDHFRSIRPEVVIHLASLASASHDAEDIVPLVQSNILLGTQLLEAMRQSGTARLINTGTFWQHYQNQDYSPVSLYAATKQAYESIVRFYVEACHIQVLHLTLYDTYGPNDPRKKLLPYLIQCCETGEPLSMSPGEQNIDLVHINDVVECYRAAIDRIVSSEVTEEKYAVSSGNPISLRELVGQIEEIANCQLKIAWGKRPYRDREVMQPWSKGRPLPGWKPQTALSDGIKSLLIQHPVVG